MHVFLTEWLVKFPGSPAFLAAFVKNSPILFFPREARLYQIGLSGALLWFTARKKKGSRVSSSRQDDGWQTGQRSVLVAWAFELTALQWSSPCLVFDPRSAFHTRACMLSTNWIIIYNHITPLQSSTLVSRSKPEMQRQHPPHRTLENFEVVLPKLNC